VSSDSDPIDTLGGRKPVPLPMAGAQRELVPCLECGKCCTYVGVGINSPTTARYATDVLWYLYHEGVYVYCDGDGEWSVHFETRCRNLADDLMCRIYEERPHVCRAFDNVTCEVNSDQGTATSYREPQAFLDWLKAKHPRVFKRIEKKYLPKGSR
jgi:Fe-S-cluster containining protein